ncbi:FAD/NAD(P)-binding protein [Thiohalobacter sp. IOR34]|uniref:FAD/NAD(P)-binding protein n=1 Tax=Thiohalobacter sp. IOR34 TaxID=3057176 RepID=UPI0025B03813|nr:FAD/NAD(P)-binding protein [Thiohalobacter sp. IOR34]WJW74422.1 FAD/NAD(P)-binding protein [Thiohalobacter sp. IOR34]
MPELHTPRVAEVVSRRQESPSVFSLGLRLYEATAQEAFRFQPGQFNMLYLYGVGEVPISIVSDPGERAEFVHTIRAVGRVTRGLARLRPGDRLGLRGPYGRGWPLEALEGRDILLLTGGLGCAPLVSVVHYILRRRSRYGRLCILQGVKHMDDLIWRERYEAWMQEPEVQVLLAADVAGPGWRWHVGLVTELLSRVELELSTAAALLCGPEPMMVASVQRLLEAGMDEAAIWLSMERNMQCAVGLCGHCQHGSDFVCRDGPVFAYPRIRERLGLKGY